jgi:hypothetical protein
VESEEVKVGVAAVAEEEVEKVAAKEEGRAGGEGGWTETAMRLRGASVSSRTSTSY